jgi:hypothetical protein
MRKSSWCSRLDQIYIDALYLAADRMWSQLPSEISNTDEFVRLSERASECRVKRLKDIVKLKLRTSKRLYTINLDPDKAAEVLKLVKCEVIEA